MLFLRSRKQDVTALAFSPDGTKLAAGGTGKRVDVWDLAASVTKPRILPALEKPVAWVGFTPDGLLVAASERAQFQTHDPAGETTTARGAGVPVYSAYVDGVALTPDGGVIGTGWHTRRWDLPGFELRWAHENVGERVWSRGGAALLPGGRVVVATTDGRETWFETRDTGTGELLDRQLAARVVIRGLRISPDGGHLLYLRDPGFAEPGNQQSGALVVGSPDAKKFEHLPGEARQMAFTAAEFHPSGRWVAAAQGDGTVRVFDVPGWREVRAYQWPVGWVRALAFDRDGTRAAAGGDGGRVVVWDLDV